MASLESATTRTFLTLFIYSLMITTTFTQPVTNDTLTTPTTRNNDAPTSVPTATTLTTDGENGATISTATYISLSTTGVDGTSTDTPVTNDGGSGVTENAPSTTGVAGTNTDTPIINDGGSGATENAPSATGVDDTNTDTPITNDEGYDATDDAPSTISGVGDTNTDTPITNDEGSGVTKTAPRGMCAGGASKSVDNVHSENEGGASDVFMSPSSNSSNSSDTQGFNSGASEWIWSSLMWNWDIILQLFSAIIGILGNLLVIVVVFSRRSSGKTTDILIGSLAVADFVTSFAIIPYPTPIRVPNTWKGMLWCLVMFQNLPLWLPVTASSYILMAISVERYIAVVYPLKFSHIVTVRRVNIAVGFIWFLALLSLLFGFFVTGVDKTFGFCTLTVTTQRGLAAMGYYWFCLRILVPVATMLITQTLIALELHRQSKNFRGTNSSTTTSFHIVARNRVLKIMLEIIIIYIVCWLPNQVAFLGVIVGFIEWSKYIESPLHRVLTVIGFYNSCLNPVIYSAQHPQFRNAVKELFRGNINKSSSVFSEHKTDSSDKKRYSSKDTSSI